VNPPWISEEIAMPATPAPVIPVLEPAAEAFAKATSKPPFLYQMPPEEGRRTVDEIPTRRAWVVSGP
jgi:hypothetical protein